MQNCLFFSNLIFLLNFIKKIILTDNIKHLICYILIRIYKIKFINKTIKIFLSQS